MARGPEALFIAHSTVTNATTLNLTGARERGSQEVPPLLAQDPLHSIRATHDATSAS
jgi:hypothetical protein